MTNQKYIIAYIEGEENYKFLCVKDNNKITIIYDYISSRKDLYVGCEVENEQYITKPATDEDLDEAFINKI